MLKRIDDHIEFHKAIDTHKSDVVFLEELKAYVLSQQKRIIELEFALGETFEQVYDNPHIDALIERVLPDS